ncbi:hypothetical protein VTK26DRAFT_8038 [Humicola hyalothermophila]
MGGALGHDFDGNQLVGDPVSGQADTRRGALAEGLAELPRPNVRLELPSAGGIRRDIGELRDATRIGRIAGILGDGFKTGVGRRSSFSHGCWSRLTACTLLGRCWWIVCNKNGIGASDFLGLRRGVVFLVTRLVSVRDIGNSGMVEPLRRVAQWLPNRWVLGSAVFIHDRQAKRGTANASLKGGGNQQKKQLDYVVGEIRVVDCTFEAVTYKRRGMDSVEEETRFGKVAVRLRSRRLEGGDREKER